MNLTMISPSCFGCNHSHYFPTAFIVFCQQFLPRQSYRRPELHRGLGSILHFRFEHGEPIRFEHGEPHGISQKSQQKMVVPLNTWILISNFKLAYNLLRRPDGTFNRELNEFLDRKVSANANPVDGVYSFDVRVVPLNTWILISNFKLAYNFLRRPDGTFNRELNEFLDRKVPANANPVDGVYCFDVQRSCSDCRKHS
ncbi:gibberellin receptor GID1A-like isoform X2 [Primulina eburnea]|uniref:gibberellin receptor GID1A-like isoform X2 n=1 Tax=Primulina eburnea TaxID=1245227 RepID=UPI003C6C960B